MHDLHGRVAAETHVTPPGVEVGGVRLHVLGGGSGAVRVEDELVGGEEEAADRTLDALGSRGVVPVHHHQYHQQLIIITINDNINIVYNININNIIIIININIITIIIINNINIINNNNIIIIIINNNNIIILGVRLYIA